MTSDEQALLAAVAAAPDADLPRLVYSDWLQDRGDERFEWVRDRELFAWMGPTADNPIPKLLDALAVAASEEDDEGEEVARLQDLIRRCGSPAVPHLLVRLRDETADRHGFVEGVAAEHPAALAENRAALEQLLAGGADESRDIALRLLVRAGEADPTALGRVFAETRHPDFDRRYAAYRALGQARGPAADAVLAAWLPELAIEAEQPDLAEEDRSCQQLECLAGLANESADLTATFRRAAAHPHTRFAAAGLEGLAHLPGTEQETANVALRTCTPGNVMEVYSLVRRLPDWDRRLTEAIASPATPESARRTLVRNLSNLDHDWEVIRPVYEAALAHPDAECRCHALMSLQDSAGPTDAVRALLRSADEDANVEVRQMALQSFVQRDDTPERQRVAALAAALGEKEFGVAERATELMQLQGLADQVADRLRGRLDEPDEQARARAMAGLVRIGAETAEIVAALRDRSVPVRRATARAISEVLPAEATHLLKPLRKALADPDALVRGRAAVALGRLEAGAADAAPEVLELARDDEPHARAGALQALPKIAPHDAATTKALRRGLRDEDDRVVKATLVGLKEYYHPEPSLQEAIFPWTRDKRAEFRRAAFEALYYLNEEELMPEAVEALRLGLADPDADVAKAATAAVNTVRKKADPLADALIAAYARPDQTDTYRLEEILAELPAAPRAAVALLGSPHAAVRQRTLAWIGRQFEKSPDRRSELAAAAVPFLPALLAQERGEKLATVLDLIHIVGPPAAACFAELLPLLDHSNPAVRDKAFATIGRLGAAARPATDRLTDAMLNAPVERTRAAAAASVVSLAEHDPTLVPAVTRQFREGGTAIRRSLAERCGLHPAVGPALIPELARCLAPAQEREVREAAAASLGRMGEPMRRFVGKFAGVLSQEPDESARRVMAEAFGNLGAVAADAVPDLMKHFRSEASASVRSDLIKSFSRIPGPDRGRAVALGLNDPDSEVREQVAMVLGDIGADAVPILPAVCKALENPKWDSINDERMAEYGQEDFISSLGIDRRQFLIQALEELGPLAEPALPTLAKLLDDRHEGIRRYAVDAMGSIGRAAIPALKKATRSRDESVRKAATAKLEEWSQS